MIRGRDFVSLVILSLGIGAVSAAIWLAVQEAARLRSCDESCSPGTRGRIDADGACACVDWRSK